MSEKMKIEILKKEYFINNKRYEAFYLNSKEGELLVVGSENPDWDEYYFVSGDGFFALLNDAIESSYRALVSGNRSGDIGIDVFLGLNMASKYIEEGEDENFVCLI